MNYAKVCHQILSTLIDQNKDDCVHGHPEWTVENMPVYRKQFMLVITLCPALINNHLPPPYLKGCLFCGRALIKKV